MDTQSIRTRITYINNADAAMAAAITDPRAENCRGFLLDAAGKVVGIHLVHVPMPSARYALYRAEMLDEYQAQGNTVVTVTVLDEDGVQTAERAMMAWPFPELNAPESPVGPGNAKNEFVAESPYSSNVIGPLAFGVYDARGVLISDIIGGYGLPDRRHISGRVTFRERSEVIPEPEPEPEPGDLTGAVARIATAVERLAAHLGA